MKDGRKLFFTTLLTVLLIVSNIVAIKMTVVAKLPISCSAFMYPFTFLCTSIIAELHGNNEARKSVLFALIIQIIVLLIYVFIANLPNQIDTIDKANALQKVLTPFGSNGKYYPELRTIISSLLAFTLGQLVNIGLYSFARKNTFKIIAVALSVVIAMIVDTCIYVLVSQVGLIPNNELILLLVNRLIVNVVIASIIVVLFMLFTIKKREQVEVKKTTKKGKTA